MGRPTEPAWFETRDVRVAYEGYSTVRLETVALPNGEETTREVVEHGDAVAMVPVTDDGEVLLLRQYRQALRGYILEVPAGKLDVPGESPAAAAARELREEVQREARDWRWLTTFHNSAGWCTEQTHVYLATGLSVTDLPDGFQLEAEEADMEIVALPLTACLEMVRRGDVTDAKTIVGLLLAEPHVI